MWFSYHGTKICPNQLRAEAPIKNLFKMSDFSGYSTASKHALAMKDVEIAAVKNLTREEIAALKTQNDNELGAMKAEMEDKSYGFLCCQAAKLIN